MSLVMDDADTPSGYTLGVLPSICTNQGNEQATDLVYQLSTGKLRPVPVQARDTTSPDDIRALNKLRETCPADRAERPAISRYA
jgi:hypothetical protein